ncbi:membrane protein YfhO [Pedobacter westerhofensis]|uniref:Membrane protein YfhO n=1 Tax=Pedobacter westerhofensis TaxID=425512 RepID=A0A521CBS0_9SPHI|nr:YfhO family protein [Pedobacter westerhofensis]SMO56887.1 membrane protein YfhO [Pedobacter westerhofensis]
MNNWLKRNGIHLAISAFFVIICFVYFSPVLQGKVPQQGDVLQAKAMQKEIMDYKAKDGKGPLWTNQMFGGMPAYQIWVQYPLNLTTYGISLIKDTFPDPVGTVLLYLLGSYLLFCVLRINPWLAAAGAIAFSFTSYNFIIIAAGHSNKALAIGFFAPILAGIILTLRGRYLMGASLTALFLALDIRANHIQMTYYLLLALIIYIGIEIYAAVKEKRTQQLGKAMGYLGIAVLVSVMINAGSLWTTYEYGKETIRGKSNLKTDAAEPDNGLPKDYAYQWSQGVSESLTFLIPNLYGGGNERLDASSNVAKAIQTVGATPEQAADFAQRLPVYWGDKPFTAGPYYFGAIICFLFVFGLFIVRDRMKWWILSATILLMLLSFGKNFPLISDFFFDYVPLYNKFRAVESILAVVGLLFPILALLAIKEAQEGKYDQKFLVKKLTWSAGITGGFALLVAIMPTLFFSFRTSDHEQFVEQLMRALNNDRNIATTIANALIQDRVSLARADAIRTVIFVAIGFGLIWALITKKMKADVVFGILAIVILFDMWQVDRRYLNNQNFVPKNTLTNHYQPRDVDTFIMADKDPDFRVFDTSIPTFTSADASYFHKTVGGAHSARLKRIQELIDHQFTKSVNQDVLDMLNTKYIITQDQQTGAYKMQRNETAAGNAWIVDKVQFVQNSDEEMKAISSFDPKKEAIVDIKYKSAMDTTRAGLGGPTSFIKLDSYGPDHMIYSYSAPRDVIAVFSEIYYDKGWKMLIDGKEKPYFRADYVLRAAQLESGNHKLEFVFHPTSYYTGEKISLAGSILLVLGLGFAFYSENKKGKRTV